MMFSNSRIAGYGLAILSVGCGGEHTSPISIVPNQHARIAGVVENPVSSIGGVIRAHRSPFVQNPFGEVYFLYDSATVDGSGAFTLLLTRGVPEIIQIPDTISFYFVRRLGGRKDSTLASVRFGRIDSPPPVTSVRLQQP